MELLKTSEVAAITGLHRNTIRNWINAGKFPKGKLIGHARRWLRSDVEAWMMSQFESETADT